MRRKDLVHPIRSAHSKPKRQILSLTPHITRRMSFWVLQYIHGGLGQAASPPSLFVSSSREHLALVLAEGRAPVNPRGIQVELYSSCYPYVFVAAPTNVAYLVCGEVRKQAEPQRNLLNFAHLETKYLRKGLLSGDLIVLCEAHLFTLHAGLALNLLSC